MYGKGFTVNSRQQKTQTKWGDVHPWSYSKPDRTSQRARFTSRAGLNFKLAPRLFSRRLVQRPPKVPSDHGYPKSKLLFHNQVQLPVRNVELVIWRPDETALQDGCAAAVRHSSAFSMRKGIFELSLSKGTFSGQFLLLNAA